MGDDVATRRSSAEPAGAGASPERYVLHAKLGEGAMGVVWSARDTVLDREVALKLLHDSFLGADHQALLAREARAMARLSHPNVVAVYDAGEQGGRAFVAMELVRGQPLSAWLATPRAWQAVLDVFRPIADGLAVAHAAGILHRDIKPSNILIGDDGRPRIADFGVAHASATAALDPETPLTATTAGLVGSPAYMSLERICGEPADARGDQFSYCVALYEALHGRRPFDAPTVGGMITAIARGVPAPARDVPDWLHAVVARGLAANPGERYPSMTALAAALRGSPAPRRRAVVLLAAGVAVIAAAALVVWQLAGSSPAPAPDAGVASAVAVTPADAAPDAHVAAEPPPDAPPPAPPADASPPHDAPRITPPPPRPPGPTPAEIAALDDATARAKVTELLGKEKEAFTAKEFRTALGLAEEAILYARGGNTAPRRLAAVCACAVGDEKRARAHFAKVPQGESMNRIAIVKVCRHHTVDLEDLLTRDEALASH